MIDFLDYLRANVGDASSYSTGEFTQRISEVAERVTSNVIEERYFGDVTLDVYRRRSDKSLGGVRWYQSPAKANIPAEATVVSVYPSWQVVYECAPE